MKLDRASALRYALLLPLAAGLVAHSLVFDFVSDDAYISFVYSRNLAEHGQLVFNLGDRVEGYTNFLWTILLAALMKVGVAPEISARVLGTAFGVGTLVVTLRLCERVRGRASLWDLLPAALLAASSGFACWCSGGLETQMFTFFVVLGVHLYLSEQLPRAGVVFALAALTRPEGNLVFAVVALHRLGWNLAAERRLRPTRAEWLLGGAYLALFVPYFAWRWWYYGWPFPNTAYVKAGGTPSAAYHAEMLAKGAFYVWNWAWTSKAIFAAPFAVLAAVRHRRFGTLAWALSVVYLLYAWRVGGDFMGLHRFVMPLFVTTALLCGLGVAAAAERVPASARVRLPVAIGATVALLVGFGWSQERLTRAALVPVADPRPAKGKPDRGWIDRPGYLKQYADDRRLIGLALRAHLRPDDFSFVGGVGVQPYYARMRAHDVFGLVSEDIAHNVAPTNARPGHQKFAPPELVLRYHPTFIFFVYGIHSGAAHRFTVGNPTPFNCATCDYEPVTIEVPGARKGAEYYTFLKRKDRAWP